jgi:hypothetical protein
MERNTPKSLTRAGLLGVLIVAGILLPLWPTLAQTEPTRQSEEKKTDTTEE